MKEGNLFIIAAPSGAGKTSLVTALLSENPDTLRFSVSHTTRAPRSGEKDGVHYHFISQTEFEQLIQQDAFLEYATVFGNYYGTTKESVERQLQAGYDVILEIDWQGAQQVKTKLPQAIGVFILPPSLQTLRERLVKRAQDDGDVILRRYNEAKEEIKHYTEFDYLVINEDFSSAFQDLQSIIRAQQLTLDKQEKNSGQLLGALLAES